MSNSKMKTCAGNIDADVDEIFLEEDDEEYEGLEESSLKVDNEEINDTQDVSQYAEQKSEDDEEHTFDLSNFDDVDIEDDQADLGNDTVGSLKKTKSKNLKVDIKNGSNKSSKVRRKKSKTNLLTSNKNDKLPQEAAEEMEAKNTNIPEGMVEVNKITMNSENNTTDSAPKTALKSVSVPVSNISITLTFETGRQKISFGELDTLEKGYTFVCQNPVENPVEIRANGTLIGYGQLVDVDGKIGVQITKFL